MKPHLAAVTLLLCVAAPAFAVEEVEPSPPARAEVAAEGDAQIIAQLELLELLELLEALDSLATQPESTP